MIEGEIKRQDCRYVFICSKKMTICSQKIRYKIKKENLSCI